MIGRMLMVGPWSLLFLTTIAPSLQAAMPLPSAGSSSGRVAKASAGDPANDPARPDEAQVFPLQATGVDGRTHPILPADNVKAVALVFLMHDCPVANSYAPELRRIHDEYAGRAVQFYWVHVDPDLSPEHARRHARQFNLPGTVLLDPDHELVAAAGVTRVPEAALFSPRGPLLYRGRIDDLYAGFGKRRQAAIELDLRNALDAVLAGWPPPPPAGEVIGCPVPMKRDPSGK
jgi:hypothetical protein